MYGRPRLTISLVGGYPAYTGLACEGLRAAPSDRASDGLPYSEEESATPGSPSVEKSGVTKVDIKLPLQAAQGYGPARHRPSSLVRSR